jgi:ATP-binding cassette subfamily A (ABC1) protein 3
MLKFNYFIFDSSKRTADDFDTCVDTNNLKDSNKSESNNIDDDTYGLWIGSKSNEVNGGFILLLQQLQILMLKRIIHTIRNKLLMITQLLIPISFLVINLLIIKYGPIRNEELPSLEINFSPYENTFVPYLKIEKNDNSLDKLVNAYSFELSKSKKIKQINLENTLVDSLCESYRNNIEEYLICLCEISHLYLLDKSIVGATFKKIGGKLNLIGHFNNQPLHVPPLTLNLFTNSILRSLSNSSNYHIRIFNYPLPKNTNEIVKSIVNDSTSFNIASGLTFGFAFLLSSFAVFLIKERVSGSKHLQFMNGSNRIIFWVSTLTWDLINYLIPVAAVLVVLKVYFKIYFFLSKL